MSLSERLQEDLKAAMKARDDVAKRTIRMVKTDLAKKEADLGRALNDDEAIGILSRAMKSRRDSITEYEKGGRAELAEGERAEIEVIQRYLPAALSDDDAETAIAAIASELGITEKKRMGELMKAVMAKYRGQIEGKTASRIAGSLLS